MLGAIGLVQPPSIDFVEDHFSYFPDVGKRNCLLALATRSLLRRAGGQPFPERSTIMDSRQEYIPYGRWIGYQLWLFWGELQETAFWTSDMYRIHCLSGSIMGQI
jgi:hypothetical protein